jgi:hypothetical protein
VVRVVNGRNEENYGYQIKKEKKNYVHEKEDPVKEIPFW